MGLMLKSIRTAERMMQLRMELSRQGRMGVLLGLSWGHTGADCRVLDDSGFHLRADFLCC